MVPWNYDTAAHLLRRTGFGAPRAEVEKALRMGQEDAVEQALRFKPSGARFRSRKRGTYGMQRWWALRMLHAKAPLAEKLTLFWHNHFATSDAKVENMDLMSQQNALFRSMGAGRFEDLLLAVSRDPAMMIWLDNIYNVKGSPNENYAREIMELFSLGVLNEQGEENYSQQDVVDAARAFTGWSIGGRRTRFEFHDYDHDYGTKSVLGMTGNLDGTDVVRLLANHPQCGRWISNRLWTFFAHPDPAPAVIDAMALTYAQNDTAILPVLRTMLLRDEFYTPQAMAAQVSSPVEFVLGTLRALGGRTNGEDLPYWLGIVGQDLFFPPNVAGWPGGLAWMNSVTRMRRFEWAYELAMARGRDRRLSVPVEDLLKGLPKDADTGDVVDAVLRAVGPIRLTVSGRSALVDYMEDDGEGGTVPFDPTDRDAVDLKVRGLVGLALTLPEAHLG